MNCFFRDDTLSDLIGFTYATWHGDDAAANLVNELVQLGGEIRAQTRNHAVLIALDGENAWEHYPFNGYYFLRALYAQLATHPQLELTTLSGCLARGVQPAPLPRVWPAAGCTGRSLPGWGSAKNRAWDLLCEAKEAYDRVCRTRPGRGAARSRRAAAGAVRELRLVLVVRRLQPGRCGEPVRSALSSAAGDALPAAEPGATRRSRACRSPPVTGLPSTVESCAAPAPVSARMGTTRLPVFDRRRAGVLLPLSALDAAARARRARLRRLARAAGLLGVADPACGPTGADGSPYWVRSDFAGNPELLDSAELPDPYAPLDPQFLAASAPGWPTTRCSRR